MRRKFLRSLTILITVCGLVGFGLLWWIGSNFRLERLSRELLAGKSTEQLIAFVDVNVVPMDSERVVPHQTVIVRDGRIAAICAAETLSLPVDALRVDGRGKYLMPGLTDMHAHILINLDDPLLFVANGVTTVRSMSSYAPAAGWLIPNLPYRSHADLRDKIARGSWLVRHSTSRPVRSRMPPAPLCAAMTGLSG